MYFRASLQVHTLRLIRNSHQVCHRQERTRKDNVCILSGSNTRDAAGIWQ